MTDWYDYFGRTGAGRHLRAMVLDEGLLFRTNESAFVETKRKLVDECDTCAKTAPGMLSLSYPVGKVFAVRDPWHGERNGITVLPKSICLGNRFLTIDVVSRPAPWRHGAPHGAPGAHTDDGDLAGHLDLRRDPVARPRPRVAVSARRLRGPGARRRAVRQVGEGSQDRG